MPKQAAPTPKKPINIKTIIILALILLAACSSPSSPQPASRQPRSLDIISLVPALSSGLKKLNATSSLIAITRYCPLENIPIVATEPIQPHEILALNPSLVLGLDSELQREALNQLEALNLKVMRLPLLTLSDMTAATQRLAEITQQDATPLLAAWKEAIRPVEHTSSPKVLLVYALEGGHLYTTGGGDYLSELIQKLGGSLTLSGPPTMRIGLERVLAATPDIILHVAPTAEFPDHEAARRYWSQFQNMPAVISGRIYVHPNTQLGLNAISLLDEIPMLKKWLGDKAP